MSKRTKKILKPKKAPQRPIDIGRKRSGENTNPRRKLELPVQAWQLIDRAADGAVESWPEWARGALAIAAAQHLKLDEAETLALFDGRR